MNLRYIALFMDFDSNIDENVRNEFNSSSRFISNYLSTQIRKIKYKTDGSYNMISIAPSKEIQHQCRIIGDNSLQARVPFNMGEYISAKNEDKILLYEYYLKLIEQGYTIASEYKKIPLSELFEISSQFKAGNYKNEWLHKKKRFKEYGIEALLKCFFTSVHFHLELTVNDIRTKARLIQGIVIQTMPNEVYFDHLFKDLILKDDNLIITEYLDRPKFIFTIKDILNRKFDFQITNYGVKYEKYNP